jgi:hypothetical protein
MVAVSGRRVLIGGCLLAAVSFDVQTGDDVKPAAHVVYYSANRWTADGFIYLLGQGGEWYRGNISTILRDGQDGRWHHASEGCGAAISARLQ